MAGIRARLVAAAEVIAVFLAAAFLFRSLADSPVRAWEQGLGAAQASYFVEYAALLALVAGILFISRCSFSAYGLTLRHPKYLLNVVATALLPFLMLGAALSLIDWRQGWGALIISLLALGILVLIALLLRKNPPPGETLALGACLLVLANSPLESTLLKTLYVYLLVGPAEESLFRGTIQSRLNLAWGRSYRFLGVDWGWGVVFASVLFGLWHVLLMPSAPGVWLQAAWTACAGLAFGYLRERSGSIAPSAFLHSVMNYVPFTEFLGT